MEDTKKNSTNIFFRGFNYLSQIYVYIFVLIIDVIKVTLQLSKSSHYFWESVKYYLVFRKKSSNFCCRFEKLITKKGCLIPIRIVFEDMLVGESQGLFIKCDYESPFLKNNQKYNLENIVVVYPT